MTSRAVTVALTILAGAALLIVGLVAGWALSGLAEGARSAAPAEDSVDAGFARDMQVHHGQAVEMSVLVRDRTEDADVRGLALDVLLTQQNQQGQMFGWLSSWGLPQSSTLPVMGWMGGDDMAGMDHGDEQSGNPMVAMGLATPEQVAQLRDTEGEDAERLYLQLMIPHHEGGVQMAELAVGAATEPEVIRLARAMATAQQVEIEVFEDLLDERGGPLTP